MDILDVTFALFAFLIFSPLIAWFVDFIIDKFKKK